VNLSPVQFGSHTLELEITETAMLADTSAVLAILHQ